MIPEKQLPPDVTTVYLPVTVPEVTGCRRRRGENPLSIFVMLVVTMFFPTNICGQELPKIGSASTFDVATWNVEWFGDESNGPTNDTQQLERVLQVILDTDAELWALQEIADPDDFETLLTLLGDGYSGQLATEGGNLYTAFIYKNDVVFIRDQGAVRHILTDEASRTAFAGRPPLLMEVSIRAPDGSFSPLVLVTLHMKAQADFASYTKRQNASKALKQYLDLFFAKEPVIVLGDFNDKLSGSITPGQVSPFQNFLFGFNDYRFASRSIGSGPVGSWCPNSSCTGGSVIDHILITDELFDRLDGNMAYLYDAPLDVLPAYVSTVSDHLPVYARFGYTASTESLADVIPNDRLVLGRPYPFPASQHVRIPVTFDGPGNAQLAVYDMLGVLRFEQIVSPASGFADVAIDCSGWPSGMYVVTLERDSKRFVQRLAVVR